MHARCNNLQVEKKVKLYCSLLYPIPPASCQFIICLDKINEKINLLSQTVNVYLPLLVYRGRSQIFEPYIDSVIRVTPNIASFGKPFLIKTMAKRFINAPSDVVPELMQGLALDSSRVSLLEQPNGHHIAIRSQIALGTQSRRVSVVSGGGSGHEPMACGYVGDGMLAAGVAGSIFVSPSIPAVSAMLNAVVSSSTGILVVVMNYQGDRLNFSMAVDDFKTRHPHVPVHIMFVADDIALPHVEEKRGIAGSVFVLKVAAAAADEGRPLEEVAAIAHVAANSLVTLGVALEPCTIPGHAINVDRLAAHESKFLATCIIFFAFIHEFYFSFLTGKPLNFQPLCSRIGNGYPRGSRRGSSKPLRDFSIHANERYNNHNLYPIRSCPPGKDSTKPELYLTSNPGEQSRCCISG